MLVDGNDTSLGLSGDCTNRQFGKAQNINNLLKRTLDLLQDDDRNIVLF
jgi:hypothetical protein